MIVTNLLGKKVVILDARWSGPYKGDKGAIAAIYFCPSQATLMAIIVLENGVATDLPVNHLQVLQEA